LAKFDDDLAAQARAMGCQCGGRLDRACYARKPRGGPAELGSEYQWRWSFCCAVDGCRRRMTPASVRYLGRRVYLGVVVVLATAMQQGLSPRRIGTLGRELGISVRTLRRWRQWWREAFPQTDVWRAGSARFMPPVEPSGLPLEALERFGGVAEEQVLGLLRLLAPLTTSAAKAMGSAA
jgi:hypothetical protein